MCMYKHDAQAIAILQQCFAHASSHVTKYCHHEALEIHLAGGAKLAMMHMSTQISHMTAQNFQRYAMSAMISQPAAGLKVP